MKKEVKIDVEIPDNVVREIGIEIWDKVFSDRYGFDNLADTIDEETFNEIYMELGFAAIIIPIKDNVLRNNHENTNLPS